MINSSGERTGLFNKTELEKINHGGLEVSQQGPVKESKFSFAPGKLRDIFLVLIGISILVCLCLIASVYSLSLDDPSFSGPSSGWCPLPLPEHLHAFQNSSDIDSGPTNMSHILFGIGGSAKTYHSRSSYNNLWWNPNTSRGFVWLDKKPAGYGGLHPEALIPCQISKDWTRFKYSHSQSAVRIARIVYESFKLGFPNVRWFVMGDDDTVFFTENLVTVLGKYDHNQMYYIGGNSESVEQDLMHSYDMAFGGGGFAVSYALAAQLAKILDDCLNRYYYFYGSDQRIWACVSEIGVPLTKESGFHQLDIKGDPYGLLAAHPMAPLVSLHHLDSFGPLFPSQSTQTDSLENLLGAYRVDPARILQQSFCYDHKREWSISISWGYSVQIYPTMLTPTDLQTPLQTFQTWRSRSEGPFTFNTRPMSSDPCNQPVRYFLDQIEEVGTSGSLSGYQRFVDKDRKCLKPDHNVQAQRIRVSALKLDQQYWKNAPRRQCCQIMDGGSIKEQEGGIISITLRKCRPGETINSF
ncbi:hypothetical protein K1719_027930 [Acacia pycnantha]|nr:hypothetical protein K1719_027930 [Acacia pycnantha]